MDIDKNCHPYSQYKQDFENVKIDCLKTLWYAEKIRDHGSGVCKRDKSSSKEEEVLGRNVKKFKDSSGENPISNLRRQVSYKDSMIGDILGAYAQAFRFDRDIEEKEVSDTEVEKQLEGMVEVPLSKETKAHIRAPWSKALIVKVYGRTVSFSYLTFKINTLWSPRAKNGLCGLW